jgi:hypothetical protein
MTTIKIVEREYPILGSKREVSKTAEQILYAKDNRKNLSPDEETVSKVLFKRHTRSMTSFHCLSKTKT